MTDETEVPQYDPMEGVDPARVMWFELAHETCACCKPGILGCYSTLELANRARANYLALPPAEPVELNSVHPSDLVVYPVLRPDLDVHMYDWPLRAK